MTDWFDDVRCTAFCLIEAPDGETIERAHNEAQSLIPNKIIEVEPAVVEAFWAIQRSANVSRQNRVSIDAGFRAIMFTDL
ncbi:MAG TPA: nickel-binding protein [Candidatus Binatia bacterium]|nr:nickel-binding protein [Candidatus Binatia bacterium]